MTTEQMLDERYGRATSGRKRLGLGIAIALGAVATLLLGWAVYNSSVDSVDSDSTGFEVIDEHTVTLRFQVTAVPGRDISCVIEAQDEDFGIVGWRVVSFAGSDATSREFEESIPTTALATTGFVNSCWVS